MTARRSRSRAEDRAKLESEGRKPHWRFKLSQAKVRWRDLIRGEVEIDTAHLSDPVLIREDGRFLYTLPSVVDDIDFAVTHIVRGEDHVTNTAAQIEIFEALGAAVPAFAHFPLLVGSGGEALSKRIGSLSLRELREGGIEPLALASYLAKTGTSDAVELRASLDDARARVRFRQDRPRARAFRSQGARGPERQAPACVSPMRPSRRGLRRSACRRRRVLGRGEAEPHAPFRRAGPVRCW